MIADLTMIATLPVNDTAVKQAQDEADKAAAGETMPPPKETNDDALESSEADRVARRGQDPPETANPRDEDRK